MSDDKRSSQILPRKQRTERRYFDEKVSNPEDVELPIRYTTSEAYGGARSLVLGFGPTGEKESAPRIQFWSIWLSSVIFMLYFFVLREENDIDEAIGTNMSLYDRVPGLEKANILGAIRHNKQTGGDNQALYKRLADIEIAEAAEKEVNMYEQNV